MLEQPSRNRWINMDDMTVDEYLEIIPRDFIDKIEFSNSLADYVIVYIRIDDFTQKSFKNRRLLDALEEANIWLIEQQAK
jgi:hypothetical protein